YLLENRFRRGTIDKTLFIKKIKNDILLVQVYVDDIIFSSTKESLSTEFKQLMHKRFQMSSMGELTFFLGLQVEQRKNGIFLSQDKYVYNILKKFGFSSVKTASTPMETHKPLSQDTTGTDVDVHLYRSMIGSLMYLTSSKPDIMFVVCACSRFQVQPKASHMHAVKRIFRYLNSQPTLGLWYPKDSPMELIAYSDSDYAGASIDRKSIIGAEYIAASNCCGQVLWLQNQLLDYGYNFMKTKIHVDNESAIYVVKNHVYHSKTKHIEIRHHFIRDSYKKKLIEMVKIHTDYNVADLLTKAFDVTRFQVLIANIGTSKEVGTLRYLSLVVPLTKVGDEAVHKELGDRMERVATTASCLETEQDSDAQTRFEAASKSLMIHLSQELTHLDVGRTVACDEAVTIHIIYIAINFPITVQVVIRTMSSPNHSTSDIEDAFSSINILNYTSSYYFTSYFDSISDIITILLFDPRYFFIPEELLPPKKKIHSPSSSSTTLSNSSQNQTCDLVSPSSSVYTPIPPQINSIFIEKMKEGRIDRMIIRRNSDELKTELKKIRTQIIKLQKKQLGKKDKISFAYYRISDLEQIIEKIQAHHQTD
ncbi:putative ribonuclease H-like domain-containing protein, partial [Tanacetum coccineum]